MLMKNCILLQYIFYNIYHTVHFKTASCSSVKTDFLRFSPNLEIRLTTFFHCGDDVNNTLCYFSKLSYFVKKIIYFMHTVLVITDVSYGRYQIVT